MANFSRDTFNKLNHYVSVRLQQGVPILDADWNEAQDIHKFELQAFLKWFVGNGVPLGNDGFAIGAGAADDDFLIADGRCLVEGWDVVNDWAEENGGELSYASQPLFENPELADAWSVGELPALTTPDGDRADTVYLDVWEREVDSGEDDLLVNPDVGIETSVRAKREWVARVAEGVAPPAPMAGHVHYPLATREWTKSGSDPAVIDQVTDLRRTGLALQSRHDIQQIVTDAYGSGYNLNGNGQPNLKVSLREAVNALLAGGIPGTAPEWLTELDDTADALPVAVKDGAGDIWVIWLNINLAGTDFSSLWYRRYDSTLGSWTVAAELPTETQFQEELRVFVDIHDDIWLFWRSDGSDPDRIWYHRYERAAGSWSAPAEVPTGTDGISNYHAFADHDGNVWVFWPAKAGSSSEDIWGMRYERGSNSWGNLTQILSTTAEERYPFALQDKDGIIWLFWSSDDSISMDIWYMTYDGTTWSTLTKQTSDADSDYRPHGVVDDTGDIFLFWARGGDIWHQRYHSATADWSSETEVVSKALKEIGSFHAIRGVDGDLWISWSDDGELYVKRHTTGGGWGSSIRLSTGTGGAALAPMLLIDKEDDLMAFWTEASSTKGDAPYDIRHRKFFTTI